MGVARIARILRRCPVFYGDGERKNSGPSGSATLIVVDDDTEVLSAVKRVFRSEPYDLLLTDDPFKALACIQSRPIDVVLADEFMPAMLGTDLLKAARRHAPRSALIVLTGYPRSRDSGHAGEKTVDLVLSKPWNDDYLRHCVRGLLELRQGRVPRKEL
jgi:response regulator RpfG family c-di-GMP phosphodiesterase